MFGLADWVIERFTQRRTRLYELQWEATRLRERPLAGALLVVLAGNGLVFWAVADAVLDGQHRARCDDHLPAGRGRCQRGRLRRAELGAGHRRGTGRGDPPAARADGRGRSAGAAAAPAAAPAGRPPRRSASAA